MSVDAWLRGKNLSRYETVRHGDLTVHVAPALRRQASAVLVDAGRFLFWRRFRVEAEHRHGPACAHG